MYTNHPAAPRCPVLASLDSEGCRRSCFLGCGCCPMQGTRSLSDRPACTTEHQGRAVNSTLVREPSRVRYPLHHLPRPYSAFRRASERGPVAWREGLGRARELFCCGSSVCRRPMGRAGRRLPCLSVRGRRAAWAAWTSHPIRRQSWRPFGSPGRRLIERPRETSRTKV